MSETLKELARIKAEATAQATGGAIEAENDEIPDLPAGGAAAAVETTAQAAAPEGEPTETAPAAEPEEEIVIGGKTFKSQKEAFAYAESLERKVDVNEAYNQGIQEAIRSLKPAAEPEPEENFEEKFYSDPKGTLREIQAKATADAVASIQRETRKEKLWDKFLTDNPDIDREDAEMILAKNQETIGRMTDVNEAMKALARQTRTYYQGIIERAAPRKELPNRGGSVTAASGGTANRVTPTKKDDAPLDMISQMRKLREKR